MLPLQSDEDESSMIAQLRRMFLGRSDEVSLHVMPCSMLHPATLLHMLPAAPSPQDHDAIQLALTNLQMYPCMHAHA